MGTLYQSRCWSDSDAASAVYSSVSPVILSDGSLVKPAFVGSAWKLQTFTAGVLTSSVDAPAVSLSSCDPALSVADGLALGFLVVGVWVAAYAVTVLKRAK